jgi:hypothetical protein
VVPSAILWTEGAGNVQLEAVYFGSGNTNYRYESSDQSIVKVNSNGDVSFESSGKSSINVTAEGLDGQPTVTVPVQVRGEPNADLPITRLELSPQSVDMFREESQQFTAQAYNKNDEQVSADFTWKVTNRDVGIVKQNGTFEARSIGKTKVKAVAKGIIGQAEVLVHPDTILKVSPFQATVNPGSSKQFQLDAYKINTNDQSVDTIQNPSNIKWEVLNYGLPIFNIASVDQNGKVTVDNNASQGLNTTVIARVDNKPSIQPGAATVIAGNGSGGFDCNCGQGNSDVEGINASPDPLTISLDSNGQINADAVDANDNVVSGANLEYCVKDQTVASVNNNGTVSAVSIGETLIKVCNGNVETVVKVEVTQ